MLTCHICAMSALGPLGPAARRHILMRNLLTISPSAPAVRRRLALGVRATARRLRDAMGRLPEGVQAHLDLRPMQML